MKKKFFLFSVFVGSVYLIVTFALLSMLVLEKDKIKDTILQGEKNEQKNVINYVTAVDSRIKPGGSTGEKRSVWHRGGVLYAREHPF